MYAYRDINPQAPVHVLIVPKKHMDNILECDPETAVALADAIRVIAKQEGIAESGFQGPLSLETGGPAEKLAPEAPLTVVDAAERMNADAARYLAAEIEKAR